MESSDLKTLDRNEVAELLGMSERTLARHWSSMLADGLKAFKIGGEWKVRVGALHRYIAHKEAQ